MRAAEELGGQVVVKAQVLTGGRGKAGGIKLADSPDEAQAHASEILGMDIRGHVVRKVWIEAASDIAKEYYLSLTFDRGEKKPLFMLTTEGGVDIEEVAERSPEALARLTSTRWSAFRPTRRAGSALPQASMTPTSRSRSSGSSRSSTTRSSAPTRCSARSTR